MSQAHQELVDLASRIIHRHQRGRPDIAAELLMRALATSSTEHTFALALALTEQALTTVEDIRLDAVAQQRAWQPAMPGPDGTLITPADTSIEPIPLAMRMLEALHRGMTGDKEAITEVGVIYGIAERADDTVFHGVFVALVSYAVYALNGAIQVLVDQPVTTSVHGTGPQSPLADSHQRGAGPDDAAALPPAAS